MYPVSESYKTAIAKDVQDVKITGTITLKDSSIINISDEDILQGSLYFTEQCVSGEDIEIGNVYASELGLTLTSPPENPYTLDGARIIINFGINVEPNPEEDPLWEYVPLGYFYVTEIERKQTTVNLKALDGMILFDVDLSGVLTTGTPYSLVQSCCTKAGVTLATSSGDFAAFANGLSAFTIPDESKIETCRDLIMWVCQITGTFARMNRLGQLEIIPVAAGASVKTISKPERFTSDVSDFYVKVTKVTMKVGEEEYSSGTEGMTLALEENPLLAGKSEAEINAALAEILAQVTEAEYTPYNLTCAGDPALQAGDWVKLTGISNINGPEFEYSRDSVAYHPDTGEEIPVDTPIYVDFAEGRQGLMVVDGVENLLTENQSSFETSSAWMGTGIMAHEQSDDWSFHGNYSSKLSKTVDGAQWVEIRLDISEFDAGDPFSCGLVLYAPPGSSAIGSTYRFYGQFRGGLNPNQTFPAGTANQQFIVAEGAQILFISANLDFSDRGELRIYLLAEASAPVGSVVYADACFVAPKIYPTPWHIGGQARANTLFSIPVTLPADFAVGLSTKMLHAHDTATRTFWQAGDYRCYFDSTDNKIKLTNGVVEAETASVNWSENDYVGIYAGRENGNLFIQAKIAGALTDRVEAEAGAGTGETLYVGSRADGSESVNAVVADLVFHDRPEDIDPEGYLSAIPGGGGE